jgi:hypothetical protein
LFGHLRNSFSSSQFRTIAPFSSLRRQQDDGSIELIEILPPPEAVFANHYEAEAALQKWTREHGFNLSTRRRFPDDIG